MKFVLALGLLMSSSIALADTLECKLVLDGKVTRAYQDTAGVATVNSEGVQCSGERVGIEHKVKVSAYGFEYSAQGVGETIVIINGGSTDKEVYARSFCSCSSM